MLRGSSNQVEVFRPISISKIGTPDKPNIPPGNFSKRPAYGRLFPFNFQAPSQRPAYRLDGAATLEKIIQ